MSAVPRSRTILPSTQKALETALSRSSGKISLDALREMREIRVSKGTLSRILNGGSVSVQAENDVRQALGLTACLVTIEACPSCGNVHAAGDCRNQPVASVAILHPGEVVVSSAAPISPSGENGHEPKRERKPEPPCFRPRLALDKTVRKVQLLKLLEECDAPE